MSGEPNAEHLLRRTERFLEERAERLEAEAEVVRSHLAQIRAELAALGEPAAGSPDASKGLRPLAAAEARRRKGGLGAGPEEGLPGDEPAREHVGGDLLVARQMAAAGASREEIGAHLRLAFGHADPDPVLDEVFGAG